MTRKPDGWVSKFYKEYISNNSNFTVGAKREEGSIPVCLVPPALLDEVEEYLLGIHTCLPGDALTKELLDKLREVRK